MPEDLVRIERLITTFPGVLALSEDRERFGLAPGLDVATNALQASLPRFRTPVGWMRARKAFTVVMTGETVKYGNIILRKGVIPVHAHNP
jgi:hypothetical protein